jgi:hypothetical protein
MTRLQMIFLAVMISLGTGGLLALQARVSQSGATPAWSALAVSESSPPELPWARATRAAPPPGEPGKDYTPVVVPNGAVLPYRVVDGVKVFHLVAEPIEQEMAPGLNVRAWGFNGRTPGPVIEVCEADRVRIYVTNRLPTPTAIHWHGVRLPCGQDGVAGLTQPAVESGQTLRYEFIFPDAGTFMYHPHFEGMTEEGMGLVGMVVVHVRQPRAERPDRDFVLMTGEWRIDAGASRVNPLEMSEFNLLTFNGKAMPGTEPLVARLGDRVWLRFGNLSPTDHHPIHLHGYSFKIIGTDGGWVEDRSKLLPETTVLVQVGSCKVVELLADNPGDWLLHCHMTHHMMNQMGHKIPNLIGMDDEGLDEKIGRLVPGYMTMGTRGMGEMVGMNMPVPANSIPMLGVQWQFGLAPMGGMTTVLKVREGLTRYEDPGPYRFPEGTVARAATAEELQADGIVVPAARGSP